MRYGMVCGTKRESEKISTTLTTEVVGSRRQSSGGGAAAGKQSLSSAQPPRATGTDRLGLIRRGRK